MTMTDKPILQPLHDIVCQSMHGKSQPIVLLDGLSELLDLGFSTRDVHRFVRAIISQVRKVSFIRHEHNGEPRDSY